MRLRREKTNASSLTLSDPMKRFLEAGRLNSPRGLKGELRFDCWCDSIDFLNGVTYTKDGEIKNVAPNTYIVTPSGIDING